MSDAGPYRTSAAPSDADAVAIPPRPITSAEKVCWAGRFAKEPVLVLCGVRFWADLCMEMGGRPLEQVVLSSGVARVHADPNINPDMAVLVSRNGSVEWMSRV